MNKRGGIFLAVIIGLFIFVLGILFIPYFADDITTTRGDLSCSDSEGITGGTMLTCLLTDLVLPYFIWFLSSMLIGFILGK